MSDPAATPASATSSPTVPPVADVVEVDAMEVHCDGGSPAQGHPRVYLHLDPESHAVACPYCSRTFRLKSGAGHH